MGKMNRYAEFTILGIVAILIVAAAAGCGSNRKSLEELAGDEDEIRVYEVFGMDCPGCHGGVEDLVNRVDGVVASEANWEQQRLTVVVSRSAEVTDRKIFEAIKLANFTPGERVQ
ncbi:hypothetical protein GF356_02895 [candidate division GN15 bacterium]|nr:hypothetical protein [candidate division GN15 bacterium]